jgi:hypothetical protein
LSERRVGGSNPSGSTCRFRGCKPLPGGATWCELLHQSRPFAGLRTRSGGDVGSPVELFSVHFDAGRDVSEASRTAPFSAPYLSLCFRPGGQTSGRSTPFPTAFGFGPHTGQRRRCEQRLDYQRLVLKNDVRTDAHCQPKVGMPGQLLGRTWLYLLLAAAIGSVGGRSSGRSDRFVRLPLSPWLYPVRAAAAAMIARARTGIQTSAWPVCATHNQEHACHLG